MRKRQGLGGGGQREIAHMCRKVHTIIARLEGLKRGNYYTGV